MRVRASEEVKREREEWGSDDDECDGDDDDIKVVTENERIVEE